MQTPRSRNLFLPGLFLFLFSGTLALGASVSRIKTWADGEILFGSDLNGEFDSVISGVNVIDDSQISASANIDPKKISAVIDGAGIDRAPATGQLSVKPDNSTIEVNSDFVRIKDLGVTTAKLDNLSVTNGKLAADAVDASKILDGSVTGADIAGSTISGSNIAASTITGGNIAAGTIAGSNIAGLTVATGNIANQAITADKLATKPNGGTSVSVGQVAVTGSSGAFSTNSGVYVTVTGQSLTIPTSTSGRPIRIIVQPAANSGTSWLGPTTPGIPCDYAIVRGGASFEFSIAPPNAGSVAPKYPPSLSVLDTGVAASTAYNYVLQARNPSFSGNFCDARSVQMVAYEI